jgi:hypothetical protein
MDETREKMLKRAYQIFRDQGMIYGDPESCVKALQEVGIDLCEISEEKPSYSNIVAHARRELELIGEAPDVIEGYLKVMQAFADMGHSGGSAMIAIPVITQLLRQKPLGPLTDYPADWQYHDAQTWGDPEGKGIWQSRRDGQAFSEDGGKTYFCFQEGGRKVHFESVHDERPVKDVVKDPAPCIHCGGTDHDSEHCPGQGG